MVSPSHHTPARFSQQNWEEWHTSRLPPHTGPIRPVSVIFCKIPARVQPDPPTSTTAHLALQSGTGSARQCEPTACSTPRSRIPLAPSCTQLVLSLKTLQKICVLLRTSWKDTGTCTKPSWLPARRVSSPGSSPAGKGCMPHTLE